MVPAGEPTEQTVTALAQRLDQGDAIIDGGNTYFKDDVRRARELAPRGHPVRRRRHERRGLGRRARLLPDGWRPARSVRAADSHLPDAGAGSGRDAADRRAACRHDGARRLPALRPGRARPLRQDDSQRHRIRPDAVVRRRVRHPAHASSAGAPRGAALRPGPGRDRGGLAPRQRHQLVAARSGGDGADEGSAARSVHRPRRGLGRRTLDRGDRDRGRSAGHGADDRAVRAVPFADATHTFAEKLLSALRAQFGGHVEPPR